MSMKILMVAIGAAGLGLILVAFKMLKKGKKIAAKIPKDYLGFFLAFGILGLMGLMARGGVAQYPVMMGILILLASLIGGLIMANNLYEKWEWGQNAPLWKKILYLLGNILFSILIFGIVFLLCEHGGFPKNSIKNDIALWLSAIIFSIYIPMQIKETHLRWIDIPKLKFIKPVFELPLGNAHPHIEGGGETMKFELVIPLRYQSEEKVTSTVKLPLNKTLGQGLHYKIYEHNIVKRYHKPIELAEEKKKSKIYGWAFYKPKLIWWGLFQKKIYLDPSLNVVSQVNHGDVIYIERVKIWEL